jgi:hypothetical protein
MFRIIFGLCVVVVISLVIGTSAVSAADDDALDTGLLNPFALTTVDAGSVATLSAVRPPVRIPYRPPLRSPFRPPLTP